MLNLDLSKRQTEAFWATLKTSHRIKVIINVRNEDEEHTNDFNMRFGTTHLLSGSVQVDATQDVTRSLSVTFLDPFHRFRWSPDHASPGTLYTGDFLKVDYAIEVRDDNRYVGNTTLGPKYHKVGSKAPTDANRNYWVNVPVFHGPMTAYEAVGPEITIEAQGKESLLMAPYFANEGYTLHKHMHVDDALTETLHRVGEQRLKIPRLPFRLGKDVSVHPRDEPWKVINGGASDSGGKNIPGLLNHTGKHPHHGFYNARGQFCVKRLNKETVFRFYDDTVLSHPDVTYDPSSFINHVIVHGAKPQGKGKKAIKAEVSLPRHNPNSPWKLARNGKPRYLTLEVTAENLKSEGECKQRAHHLLNHHSMVGVNVAFDCLPIPTLEPNDTIRVKVDGGFELHAPLKQFTIPLTSSDSMSIGYNKRLKTTGKHGGPKGHKKHKPKHRQNSQDG